MTFRNLFKKEATPMASPTVSASLDKTTYALGDTATLTVTYADADTQPLTVTITVTDSTGNTSDPVSVTANITDSVTVTVTDDSGRTWAKKSDTGAIAVYTATI